MSKNQLTDPDAVTQALDEFDRLGRESFLAQYGFGPARRYFLLHRGMRYDSKAIALLLVRHTRPPYLLAFVPQNKWLP